MERNEFQTEEAIRARMLKHAANLWQISNPHQLDPFILRLTDLYCKELFQADQRLKSIETTLLPRIADALTPDAYTAARPAHALLQCLPTGASLSLHHRSEFAYKKPVEDLELRKTRPFEEFIFSPVDTVPLTGARVAAIIHGNTFFTQSLRLRQEALTATNKALPPSDLWIGLEIHEELRSLEYLSLCFLWRDTAPEAWFYEMLSLARISCQGTELPVQTGIRYPTGSGAPDAAQPEQLLRYITSDIKAIYDPQFLTIGAHDRLPLTRLQESLPASLTDHFRPDDPVHAQPPLLWLRLRIPVKEQGRFMEGLFVAANAVPVINKRFNLAGYDLHGRQEVFTMPCANEESFLALAFVRDDAEQTFRAGVHDTETSVGTYRLHQPFRPRFDQRTIDSYIGYVHELIRDEVVAFHAYGTDFLRETVEALSKLLGNAGQIRNVADDKDAPDNMRYLTLTPYEQSRKLEIGYWSTNREKANGIQAGQLLSQTNINQLDADDILFITTTGGARRHITGDANLHAYRYALTTRDRIVTRNDIRDFCLYQLNGLANDVTIKRNRMVSPHPQEGWVECLDITLAVPAAHYTGATDWNRLCLDLSARLEQRSAPGLRYRLSVTKV